MLLLKTISIAFLGAVLCLDRLCFQLMISRPVVTGPVIGLVLGDIRTGLLVGAFLELLWVDKPALGNYIPPNDSLLTVVITSALILSGHGNAPVSRELIVLALLVMLPLSGVSQKMDIWLITSNDKYSDAAFDDARRGDGTAIEKKHLFALFRTFLAFVLFNFIFILAGTALLNILFPMLSPSILKALGMVYIGFPVLMAAIALNTIKQRGDIPAFCALFVVAFIVFEFAYGL
ncbi:MAG: PTS sugar transporter subunit IIC [Syntrophus sp. SKADARSKE-3]|nr:PTS sugar transporter subunit IIC [Syntrophus sp. SKADARSKE-3]